MSATTAPSLSPTELVGMELSENARRVLTKRYLRRGSDGQTIESIEEMIRRVASHVASVEGEWGAEQDHYTKVFINLIASRRFLPNSPTFTGAGTPLGQLAACFVLPISDDMGRGAHQASFALCWMRL